MSKSNQSHKKSGFIECWREQTSLTDGELKLPLVLDLWNFHGKQNCIENNKLLLSNLERSDIGVFEDINDQKLTRRQRQWLQLNKVKKNDNSAFVSSVGLKAELDSHIYPLHFIDFETCRHPIPFFKNNHPNEQIVFQYSHHVMHESGKVEHKSQFIGVDSGVFPNLDFIRSLKKDLEEDNGTIFRYEKHENNVLNDIKKQLNENTISNVNDKGSLVEFINRITSGGDREMVDLCEIVKKYYYDPYTNGSNSIKYVLPAVLNRSVFVQERYSKPIYGKDCEIHSLNFENPKVWIQKAKNKILNPYKLLPDLFDGLPESATQTFITDGDLSNGGAAQAAYAKLQLPGISDIERQKVTEGLLRYCELDTLAMVMIYEYFIDVSKD
jgi:hypothetical protein